MKYAIAFALILQGCTMFTSKTEVNRKEWKLEPKIAMSLLPTGLTNYRKINRSSSLIAANILVQANSQTGIAAFDLDKNLSPMWSLKIPNGVEPSLTSIRNRLFFGASDGNLYCVDINTGEILWKFTANSEILSKPVLDGEGHLYVLSGSNVLYSLDATDGRQVWAYSRQDTSNMTIRGGASPAIDGDRIYAGFSDGTLVALALSSGAPQWEIQLNKNKRFKDIDATPMVTGSSVIVSGYDDRLYSLSKINGQVQWKTEKGGYAPVVIEDDKIYYPTSTGEIQALELSTGKLIWERKNVRGLSTEIQIWDDFLIYGESAGDLLIIDKKNGFKRFSFEPGRGVFATPTLDKKNRMIYFVSNEANLYGLKFFEGFKKPFPELN